MGMLDSIQRDNAKNEILRFIRSWQDYENYPAVICDALEAVAQELLAEHDQRVAEVTEAFERYGEAKQALEALIIPKRYRQTSDGLPF